MTVRVVTAPASPVVVRRMVNPSEGLKLDEGEGQVEGWGVRRMVNPSEGLKHQRVPGDTANILRPKDGQPE